MIYLTCLKQAMQVSKQFVQETDRGGNLIYLTSLIPARLVNETVCHLQTYQFLRWQVNGMFDCYPRLKEAKTHVIIHIFLFTMTVLLLSIFNCIIFFPLIGKAA